MKFIPITLENYIELHLKSNPTENKLAITKKLKNALKSYKSGKKCACGNVIWVIGSAFTGLCCYSCLTGESEPHNDYEIDVAMNKEVAEEDLDYDPDFNPFLGGSYFKDDGTQVYPELIPKPALCSSCINDRDPFQIVFCNLNRIAQSEKETFVCHSFCKLPF
jgi:hypothetical protein